MPFPWLIKIINGLVSVSSLQLILNSPIGGFNGWFLPQGMKNSPTLCQKFVGQIVQNVRGKNKDLYLIHYMDDILAAHKDRALLQQILSELIEALES